ncbi:MAG TPA: Stk1 family PASTA domain-containing Ser/Thr kinase [Solirubrobacteraceae bacterium]|nr:Stk1 family PASTA domain-containing Ser/Thr kinase [Solirubrobacteraceae bacterium]
MKKIPPDSVIDGRYQVIAHLGTGGMAEVYCAQDLQLGRKVALKVLHDRFAADEEFVERFRREASAAAGLQHQHVVSVYDRGVWEGTSYIAMEYVAGRTLKELVNENGTLDPQRAVDLTIQILRAARFAHRRGVIHRDFKPQNVIVDEDDRAKVTDFGIARAGASDMTQTGSIMGTAQYLSPEQAQGHAVGGRSDLYSIGIILYELLTGGVPFEADAAVTIALKQVSEQPVPPSELNPEVTPELEAVVMRALEKDPNDRFADADEFIAALEAAGSRIPSAAAIAAAEAAAAAATAAPAAAVVAPPPPPPPPPSMPATGIFPAGEPYREVERERVAVAPPPPRRRRPRWPWLVGALLLLVLGGVATAALISAPTTVPVPNVVGSSISVATQRLQNDGFEVAYVRDNSDKPRNTVIGQDPTGGSTADEGATVSLTISDGRALAAVPDVAGSGKRAARKTLIEAGFLVDEVPTASDLVRKDRVIGTQPPGRSQAEQGTVVQLLVSTGPEQVAVPDVRGKSQEDARAALEQAGFKVTVKQQESDAEDPGTVLSQQPAGGQASRGSGVTITVATEPKQITVPSVVGRSQNSATKTLSGRGFEVAVEEVTVDTPEEDGLVSEQSPEGDAKVDRGATVTITVGRFDPELNPDPVVTTTTPAASTTTAPAAPGPGP